MSKLAIAISGLVLAACLPMPGQGSYAGGAASAAYDDGQPRAITINGAAVGPSERATIAQLEARYGARMPDGDYWYDRINGATGLWGHPAGALLPAGLDLGPELPANASNGNSGVFINGRELQRAEVTALSQLVSYPWQRGRYFIDAQGNAGVEGGPTLVNLFAVARSRGSTQKAATSSTGEWSKRTGFGENDPTRTSYYSSGDGSCRTFETKDSTIYMGC